MLEGLKKPLEDVRSTYRELQRIRPDVRVVLSSGFTEQEILERFKGAGFAGFVQKPTPSELLIATIQGAMK